MTGRVTLLMPEWQGYGLSAEVACGARELAQAWWPDEPGLVIEAPDTEVLGIEDGVLGLESIAARFAGALRSLRAAQPGRLVTIGGTCGAELAPVAYLNERHAGDLAVLWLDAHADLNTPASSPSGHFHGMALRTLLGDGPDALTRHLPLPLEPRQVFLVGARDLDPPETDYAATSGVTRVGDGVFSHPRLLVDRVLAAGFGHVYLHFDVDVVNPRDFGGALLPTTGGPQLAAAADLIAHVHRHTSVAGFSVLEYCDRNHVDRDRLVSALRSAATSA